MTMNGEMLERLLMDRALGGLAPEVEALLVEYLERDEKARGRAEELGALTGLMRRAMGSEEVEHGALPALRLGGGWRRRVAWGVAAGAGMAACVAIGFWGGRSVRDGGGSVDVAERVAVVPAQREAAAEGGGEFFSVERLRGLAVRNAVAERTGEVAGGVKVENPLFRAIGG
ncbi:MAG TPA: hypothetical protein VHQ47_00060 [Phycisphaerae bacterium]|jgi:hypothetical protein|nr:hypothetical protein [Phycisphaerae bacterium]